MTKIVGIFIMMLLIMSTVLSVAGMKNLNIKNNLDFDATNISNTNEIDQSKVSSENLACSLSHVSLALHTSTNFNELQQFPKTTIRGVPFPYPTIQAAVDNSSTGDIVLVLLPGTYMESVLVQVSVTIISLWGSAYTTVEAFDLFDVDNVMIRGFTITGSSGITILGRSSNNKIINNVIYGNFNGISIIDMISTNNEIINNVIYGNEYGIYLSDTSKNLIKNNKIFNNTVEGIFILWSSDNKIINNEIIENGQGIYITRLSNNNQIKHNIISKNFFGIHLFSEPKNTQITCNEISNNEYGACIRYDSSDNKIYLNDFIGNKYNALTYTSECLNDWNSTNPINYIYQWGYFTSYMGNYWDDYTGTSGSNGIGTTPYVIEGSNIDNYPLIDPVKNYIGSCDRGKTIGITFEDNMQKDNNIRMEQNPNLFPILQKIIQRLGLQ
jgi:parallel beta-helix repeat protein